MISLVVNPARRSNQRHHPKDTNRLLHFSSIFEPVNNRGRDSNRFSYFGFEHIFVSSENNNNQRKDEEGRRGRSEMNRVENEHRPSYLVCYCCLRRRRSRDRFHEFSRKRRKEGKEEGEREPLEAVSRYQLELVASPLTFSVFFD